MNKNPMINVTEINSWLYCPRKLYLAKVKKVKDPPNRAMIIGMLKHKILELFSRNEEFLIKKINKKYDSIELFAIYENFLRDLSTKVFLDYSAMIDKFRIDRQELFSGLLESFSEDIKIRTDSLKETLKEGFIEEELWGILSPKYLSEIKVESENLGLRGKIDRIEINKKEGTIIPYEIKTRKEKIFLSDELQLTAYAMLLQEIYRIEIKKAIIELGNRKQEIEIKEENIKKIKEIINEIKSLPEKSIPPIQSNFNKCRHCGLREICLKEK